MRPTSLEAFYSAIEELPYREAYILGFIFAQGEEGVTDDEGWRQTGMIKDSYSPARYRLMKKGLVRESGKRRKTQAGGSAIVWVANTEREEA